MLKSCGKTGANPSNFRARGGVYPDKCLYCFQRFIKIYSKKKKKLFIHLFSNLTICVHIYLGVTLAHVQEQAMHAG